MTLALAFLLLLLTVPLFGGQVEPRRGGADPLDRARCGGLRDPGRARHGGARRRQHGAPDLAPRDLRFGRRVPDSEPGSALRLAGGRGRAPESDCDRRQRRGDAGVARCARDRRARREVRRVRELGLRRGRARRVSRATSSPFPTAGRAPTSSASATCSCCWG